MLSSPYLSFDKPPLIFFMLSFVRSDKKTLALPKMPPDRRKFVQEVDPLQLFSSIDLQTVSSWLQSTGWILS